MVLWERKFGSKATLQSKSACLRCTGVGNSPSHSDYTVPSQVLWCVAISLRWTVRDTMAVHNNTHSPAFNPVIFPVETRKPDREGREERADSYTPGLHPDKQAGCDCCAHLGLWAGNQSQTLPFRCTSMPQRWWAWNCPVGHYNAQATDCGRCTPSSIGIVLCCCIDKITVEAWACGFFYCCWGNFPVWDLQWPPDLAGQGPGPLGWKKFWGRGW